MRLSALAFSGAVVLGLVAGRAEAAVDCGALRGLKIDAAQIDLPTRGAVVRSAAMVAAGVMGADSIPAHCLVTGAIAPIDQKAPGIEFAVALPLTWNDKALMLGGGGFSGTIPGLTNRLGAPEGSPSPLASGYAVFGGDSGHRNKAVEPGDFMLNAEAYADYTGDALKKTHDAALVVIKAAYGHAPRRAYFWGGSTGGREGLLVAGRWPQDWDGVVSRYPALHLITSLLGGHNSARAMAEPGAWLSPAKRGLLFRAAMAACDGLDGAKDSVIGNARACNAAFDPAKASLDGKPLRCGGGADTGDTCLSDIQLRALKSIDAGVRFKFALASGDTGHPGYNVYSSDNGTDGPSRLERQVSGLSFGDVAPAFPTKPGMGLATTYGDNFLRYSIGHGDLAFNSLTVDPTNPGPEAAARLRAMSARDAADNDLSAFAARGGKLIIEQGLADTIISSRMTEQYYNGLQRRMGAAKLATFARFYEVPGWNHGFAANFNAVWNDLATLDNWVEHGVDPAENVVIVDTQGVPGRSRPLCLYPHFPRYKGSGDVNQASSFTCASE